MSKKHKAKPLKQPDVGSSGKYESIKAILTHLWALRTSDKFYFDAYGEDMIETLVTVEKSSLSGCLLSHDSLNKKLGEYKFMLILADKIVKKKHTEEDILQFAQFIQRSKLG